MHALRNRLYPAVLSTPHFNQPVPTTEYDAVEGWWAAMRLARQDRFVVIACGGSTTTFNTNWPFFLEAELHKAGLSRSILTINLGQPMHSSFDQFFLLDRFLNEAAEHAIKPDLVLSLDGTNDIGYRIQAYIWALRCDNSDASCPNEVRLLDQIGQRRTYPATSPGPYRDVLLAKSDKFADLTYVPLPEELEDRIIEAFAATLGAFRRLCAGRGIRCIDFLQPVLLKQWSGHRVAQLRQQLRNETDEFRLDSAAKGKPIAEEAAFDLVRRRHNIRLHIGEGAAIQDDPRTRGPYVFDWASIYQKSSKLWSNLAKRDSSADSADLSTLFAEDAGQVFLADGVHYTLEGSRKIAAAIAEKVVKSVIVNSEVGDLAAATQAGQQRRSEMPESREAIPRQSDNPSVGDMLNSILARCSNQSAQDRAIAPNIGWKILNGQPPLDPEAAKAWASLAAELRQMAASVEKTIPSFEWEVEHGELYPFY